MLHATQVSPGPPAHCHFHVRLMLLVVTCSLEKVQALVVRQLYGK